MAFTINEFEAVEGVKSYQLLNDQNLIVGVVAGFSSEQNKQYATLLAAAPEMAMVLNECRTALIMLSLIDKSRLSSDVLACVESVLKSAGKVI